MGDPLLFVKVNVTVTFFLITTRHSAVTLAMLKGGAAVGVRVGSTVRVARGFSGVRVGRAFCVGIAVRVGRGAPAGTGVRVALEGAVEGRIGSRSDTGVRVGLGTSVGIGVRVAFGFSVGIGVRVARGVTPSAKPGLPISRSAPTSQSI
jgi:hypothetical protein